MVIKKYRFVSRDVMEKVTNNWKPSPFKPGVKTTWVEEPYDDYMTVNLSTMELTTFGAHMARSALLRNQYIEVIEDGDTKGDDNLG